MNNKKANNQKNTGEAGETVFLSYAEMDLIRLALNKLDKEVLGIAAKAQGVKADQSAKELAKYRRDIDTVTTKMLYDKVEDDESVEDEEDAGNEE